jgi:hypothetical protein
MADDLVLSEDGGDVRHGNAFYDCRGRAYCIADNRHDADVEIVTDLLNIVDKYVCEYATGNEDWTSGYDCIVLETSHEWTASVKEWIENTYEEGLDLLVELDYLDGTDGRLDKVVEEVCAEIHGYGDWGVEYNSNEYARYSGPGCCLYAVDIGEEEEQIEINAHPELKRLHEERRLDDVLDYVRADAHVSRNRRCVKNDRTGLYEQVGRETYMAHANDSHPCMYTYHMPGGQWYFLVSEERMTELVDEALADGAERV